MWLGLALGALAQEGEPDDLRTNLPRAGSEAPRPQAVEPAYRHNLSRPDFIDRRTIDDLALGANDAAHLALWDGGRDGWGARVIKWGLSLWFGVAATHVVHEYGHISALSRCGCDSALMGDVGSSLEEREQATVPRLFAQGLWPSSGSLTPDAEGWEGIEREFAGRPRDFNRFWLAVEAGGLNQEQAFAARYAERLREGRMSYLDTPVYLWAAFGTISYPSGTVESDIDDYVARLETEGRETSASRIKMLSALRFLGGAGLASFRGGFAGAFGNATGFVEPLSTEAVDGLRVFWPDIETYLTLSGPTVKTSLPLRSGDFTLLPSYERSFAAGGVDHEGGLVARAPFADGLIWLEAALYASDRGGIWRSGEVELRPIAWLSLIVGAEEGRGYTFRRDVYGSHETYVDGSEASLLLGVRLTLAF